MRYGRGQVREDPDIIVRLTWKTRGITGNIGLNMIAIGFDDIGVDADPK